jgi:hypothetical protein
MGLDPQAGLGHPLSAKEKSSFAGTDGLDFGSSPKSERKMMDVCLWHTSFLYLIAYFEVIK